MGSHTLAARGWGMALAAELRSESSASFSNPKSPPPLSKICSTDEEEMAVRYGRN